MCGALGPGFFFFFLFFFNGRGRDDHVFNETGNESVYEYFIMVYRV